MSLIPDWALVTMTGAALCCLVLGKWRWAAVLAAPALMRFVLWPLAWKYLTGLPPLLLAVVILAALPFILLRVIRRLLILATSEKAADHALGDAFGAALLSLFRMRRP
jgi:hypothetical protein